MTLLAQFREGRLGMKQDRYPIDNKQFTYISWLDMWYVSYLLRGMSIASLKENAGSQPHLSQDGSQGVNQLNSIISRN